MTMKLARIRLAGYVVTLRDDQWPVTHRFEIPQLKFALEIRLNAARHAAYVYGTITRGGTEEYAGDEALRGYAESALYRAIIAEMFCIGRTLEVPKWHIWRFVEQLPEFTDEGIKVADVNLFSAPIRDLVALGIPPREIIESLGISIDLYRFVTGDDVPAVHIPESESIW